ncbi:hypothetical protein [Streptomyces sp. CAU 1734]|uniref:hypothetical protein n=1 Tax=Streptomyces sp. CAU 1734 TaxID=3140360 RepID=UPI00326171E3
MVTHGPAHEANDSPIRPAPEAGHPSPAGSDYYAGAREVAGRLEEAGLTPPRVQQQGRWTGEFCTVEAAHPDTWPEHAVLGVEVTHVPDAEYRWRIGRQDPPGAAEYRRDRLKVVAEALRGFGYTVEVVERSGWRPGQQALRVHRLAPPARAPDDG